VWFQVWKSLRIPVLQQQGVSGGVKQNLTSGSYPSGYLKTQSLNLWPYKETLVGVDWIYVAQYKDQWRAVVNTVMNVTVLFWVCH
jgi:hypothetical protein